MLLQDTLMSALVRLAQILSANERECGATGLLL